MILNRTVHSTDHMILNKTKRITWSWAGQNGSHDLERDETDRRITFRTHIPGIGRSIAVWFSCASCYARKCYSTATNSEFILQRCTESWKGQWICLLRLFNNHNNSIFSSFGFCSRTLISSRFMVLRKMAFLPGTSRFSVEDMILSIEGASS